MRRLEAIISALPEAERVDIEAWDGHPSFRVRGKNFVFANPEATSLTFKLDRDEAEAVIKSIDGAEATGYGLGKHGWVSIELGEIDEEGAEELEEWVRTSYTLVAPKTLARIVLTEDANRG